MGNSKEEKGVELVPEVIAAIMPVDQFTGGTEIDLQVSTARAFPRELSKMKQTLAVLTCEDAESARQQYYSLKRGGKVLEGPSIRFAEALAYAWGNLRVFARRTDITATEVICVGACWDMERNVAMTKEVPRRITKSDGSRYNQDMITTTSLAGMSLATRNAVLSAVPRAVWWPVFQKAMRVAAGDEDGIKEARKEMFAQFKTEMEVEVEHIYEWLGVEGPADVGPKQLRLLAGLYTALEEGHTTMGWELSQVRGETRSDEEAEALDALLKEDGHGS